MIQVIQENKRHQLYIGFCVFISCLFQESFRTREKPSSQVMYKFFIFKRSSHKSIHLHMNCYIIRLPSQNNIQNFPRLKFQFFVLFVLMKISNFLFILGLHSMDSQWSMQEASPSKQVGVSSGFPPATSVELPTQRQAMPPPPLFQGFLPVPNQMPFLFPHSFMPHVPGIGFPHPAHGNANATIDLSEGPRKCGPQECVTDQSKPAKKCKNPKKKLEIAELNNGKEDVELLKNIGPWKDH